MEKAFNIKVLKIIILFILSIISKSLYAQRDVEEVKRFLEANPFPEGTFLNLKEALVKPDKVLYLSLLGKGLNEFPVEILKFKNLIELELNNNNIEEIPLWIKKLTNLQKLEVRSNKLTSIPEDVFFLPFLKELDLWGNQITSFPLLSENKSIPLENLNLSMNMFNELSESILRLNHLKKLRLENNQFIKIPSIVFKMNQLQYLYLLHNRIYDFDISSPVVSKLKGIDLALNPISNKRVEDLKKILPDCEISTEL